MEPEKATRKIFYIENTLNLESYYHLKFIYFRIEKRRLYFDGLKSVGHRCPATLLFLLLEKFVEHVKMSIYFVGLKINDFQDEKEYGGVSGCEPRFKS